MQVRFTSFDFNIELANIANAMRLGIDVSFIRPNGEPVLSKRTPSAARSTSDGAAG